MEKWTMDINADEGIERVVASIAAGLEIEASEISSIVHKNMGRKVNCYPGVQGRNCSDICFFISLTSHNNMEDMHGKGKGHLSFKKAMIKIVQHMQGSCCRTKHAIFITDSWNAKIYEEWRLNLEEIQEKAILDIYLLTGDNYLKIKA